MPLLGDRAQFAIKSEANAGVAETLAAADVVWLAERPSWTPDVQLTERGLLGSTLGSGGAVIGRRVGRIGVVLHMRGTTGAPVDPTNLPDCFVPLKACGVLGVVSGAGPNEQTDFKPSTSVVSDATSGAYSTSALYFDGKKYQIHGAQGTGRIVWTVGAPTRIELEFTGAMDAPADAAMLAPSGPAVVEPPFLGAAFTVHGYASHRFSQVTLDLGNEISISPQPNLFGVHVAQIVRRLPRVTFDPDEVLAATEDLWADLLGEIVGTLDTGIYPSNGVNYNQQRFQVPILKFRSVGLGDRDGMLTAPVEADCVRGAAGDDEYTLTIT